MNLSEFGSHLCPRINQCPAISIRFVFCSMDKILAVFLAEKLTKTMLVVGVDGGATKTSAVVIKISDGARLVVGRSVSGSTNRNSVGNEAAVAAMNEVISAALKVSKGSEISEATYPECLCDSQESGSSVEDVFYAVLALSGCDTDSDVQYWKAVKHCFVSESSIGGMF